MLANCPKCGQLFNKVTREVCPKCIEKEDQLLRDTQEFLRENRNAGRHMIMMELEEVTGELLDRWVEEKRIHLVTEEDLEEQEEKARKQKTLLQQLMNKSSSSKVEKEEEEEENKPKRMGMHFKRGK